MKTISSLLVQEYICTETEEKLPKIYYEWNDYYISLIGIIGDCFKKYLLHLNSIVLKNWDYFNHCRICRILLSNCIFENNI